MMIPDCFKQDDTETLHQYIRDYGFGLLVVADEQGIDANHVPFHLSVASEGSLGSLQCHLARINPAWQRIERGASVLVIFKGPDAYVSPSWYATKAETGRVVPTWNYLAVHVEGRASVINDPIWLKEHLSHLTDQHEKGRSNPWAVDDAPTNFTDRLTKAIVGIEIRLEKLTGQLKASQNQPERNQAGVKTGLKAEIHPGAKAMSDLIGL